MKFLDPSQIAKWYQNSIQYSGYLSLENWIIDTWKSIVQHGQNALPPGLVAKLLEKLTHRPVGINCNRDNNLEESLLAALISSSGFLQLEGKFLMSKELSSQKIITVINCIVEKLGGFSHQEIYFSAKDLELSFTVEPCGDYDCNWILQEVYQNATDYSMVTNCSIDKSDLFEILHPDLFQIPSARSIYRKMYNTVDKIKIWLGGDITIREERDEVVSKFGEPQALPLGGYDSLTRKGDISSLVPSELAYIDEQEPIDFFDYKYIEKELLYFKREEGVVFRIRREVTLSLPLSYGMEHERNLADLFGFCVVLVDRLFSVFSKDIIQLHICFYNHLPYQLRQAIEFFKHYLKETPFEDRVAIHIGQKHIDENIQKENYQQWIVGDREIANTKFIPFIFPSSTALSESLDKYKTLAECIDSIVEGIVEIAHC